MKDIEDQINSLVKSGIKPSCLVISNDKINTILYNLAPHVQVQVDPSKGWGTIAVGPYVLEIVRTYKIDVCIVYGKEKL